MPDPQNCPICSIDLAAGLIMPLPGKLKQVYDPAVHFDGSLSCLVIDCFQVVDAVIAVIYIIKLMVLFKVVMNQLRMPAELILVSCVCNDRSLRIEKLQKGSLVSDRLFGPTGSQTQYKGCSKHQYGVFYYILCFVKVIQLGFNPHLHNIIMC
jgi:hypothetical protein